MSEKKHICILYATSDQALASQILKRLMTLEKNRVISIWADAPIQKDQVWKSQSDSRSEQTDVFVLLVSNAFMHSEFVKQPEFKRIIDRYKEGTSTVVPIILDKCPWDINFESDDYNFSFKELQVLPEGGKPLKNAGSTKEAFQDLIKTLTQIATGESDDEPGGGEKASESISEKKDQLAMDFDKGAEAKRRAEEEIAQKQAEKEALQKAEEKLRLRQEAEARRKAEEQRLQKEAELQRRLQEEAELRRRSEEEKSPATTEATRPTSENDGAIDENQKENTNSKKKILAGSLIAAMVLAVIFFFPPSNNNAGEGVTPVRMDTIEVKGPVAPRQTEIGSQAEPEPLPNLTIGDLHDEGIVFEISDDGKTGKVAHIDDAGPMTWKEAMKIDERLGEGWRVPTLNELKVIYKSIGQGADNRGEFTDELYWSATPYDSYQARMFRFRDGNTSYHYNSLGTHRKFLVRPIRDFIRP